jgi:sodium pump decarboxylase gamma subunit
MKKIISLTLAALMLVTVLLLATSCGMESMTGYTRLRDHVIDTVGQNNELALDGSAMGFSAVRLVAPIEKSETKVNEVYLVADGGNQNALFRLTLKLTDSTEKAQLTYQVINIAQQKLLYGAEATVLLTHYTGNDLVEFTSVTNIHPEDEQTYRVALTSMLNSALKVLDTYTTEKMDMDLHELGFIALSEKYMAPVESAEAEEDLGGAFSPARLSQAGLMIIQGMGMVFLVLAILWMVLLIFKKVFYKDPNKQDKKEEAPTEAPAPVAAPADDGALVAAITAAVAAYIDSDPALSSQFAGGFRVVSFKKKNGKTSWNH